MKKIVFILCGILSATMAKSQIVIDSFSVGPYDVDYIGKGDVNYRLKKDINLYDYYNLKKDTVVIEPQNSKPIKRAFELGLSFTTPRFDAGAFNSFGAYASGKYGFGHNFFFNYGGLLSLGYGKYYEQRNNLKDVVFELGVPLAIEYAKLDRVNPSLFASIGIIPSYYATLSAKKTVKGEKVNVDKKNGIYIAPKVEFGSYVPINEHLFKIGLFVTHRTCCSKKENDIFGKRIGRAFIGANIGLVF